MPNSIVPAPYYAPPQSGLNGGHSSHGVPAPYHAPAHAGLKDALSKFSKAISWEGGLKESLQTLLNTGQGTVTMADIEAAKKRISDFLNPSNQAYADLYHENPAIAAEINAVNNAISYDLNNFQIHVDGGHVSGGYEGYDFVVVIYSPHAADTPINYSDFMKGVNSNSTQDVRLEWQDGAGGWSYVHGTMAQIYHKYVSHAYLKDRTADGTLDIENLLRDLNH